MSEPRLTSTALHTYAPLFQQGKKAEDQLALHEKGESQLSLQEQVRLQSLVSLGNMAFTKLEQLSVPLIRKQLMKLIMKSHLRADADEIYDVIYYAGIAGMSRGLMKFDLNKLMASPTNYIFQWITTYAKKELLVLESPMGVAPSRFQKLKKIAAVRKKLTDELQRDPSDEEILEYFQSGRAEIKNFEGRKDKKGGISAANKNITIELIQEQYEVEKNLMFAQMFDTDQDQGNSDLAENTTAFSETLFGVFMQARETAIKQSQQVSFYPKRFNTVAVSVLKSELQYELTPQEASEIKDITDKQYRSLAKLWQSYLSNPQEDFVKFIQSAAGLDFKEVDVKKFATITESLTARKRIDYKNLFESSNEGK